MSSPATSIQYQSVVFLSTSPGPGRPSNPNFNARQSLLVAAKTCFLHLAFEKVTTRMLAEEAGINVGMIRYYFGSKQGLYEAMIADVVEHLVGSIREQVEIKTLDSFEPLFMAQTQVVAKLPEFPLLVQRELWGEGHCQQHLIDLLTHKLHPFMEDIFVSMQARGKLKQDIDLALLRTSAVSLLVFPFLTRPAAEKIDNVKFDDAFLKRLARHNANLLGRGCLVAPPQ